MNRVPEPELMTGDEQVEAYAAADLSELHDPLVAAVRERWGGGLSGRLLDVGCGTADIAIRLARIYPALSLLGIDGSAPMLARAAEAVRAAGLQSRVALEQGSIPDARFETNAFDAVIANSVLHHLTDPAALWHTLRGAARPGAALMMIDLHRPASVGEAQAIVGEHAAEARPILRQDFFNSLCAAYTAEEIAQQVAAAGLAGITVERLGPFHVMAWGRA